MQQIGAALTKPRYSGFNGRAGWGQTGFHRGGFDYRREAGPLHESSIPLMCLKWEQRATIEAEICVQARGENNDWEELQNHPLLDLFAAINEDFDLHRLLDAVRFDYHLSGNAYLWKSRSRAGRVVGLQWIPNWMIEPRWEENGAEFISCYEYRVDGASYALPKSDVIHFRNGVDPRSYGRKGLSDFAALLREICTDNEAAVFTASLLRNMGVPGVIISPKGTEANTPELTPDQRNLFKRLWKENFTGDKRGEPFIQSIPVDVTMPGFSPQQMVIDKVRAVPEQRLCGSFGIPASVLQLGTGLENSNTNGNKTDDREQAYESCVIPTLLAVSRQLTQSLIPDFGDPRQLRVWFDLSNVRCLQNDENEEIRTLVLACGGPFLTVNEARQKRGLKPQTGADELRDLASQGGEQEPEGDDEGDDPEPPAGGDGPRPEAKSKFEKKDVVDDNGAHHGDHDGKFVGGISIVADAVRFNDPKQAEAWAESELVRSADYEVIPAQMADTINETLESLDAGRGHLGRLTFGEHADVVKEIRRIDPNFDASEMLKGALMLTWGWDNNEGDFSSKSISYDPNAFKSQDDLDAALLAGRRKGDFHIDTLEGLLTHEYGHVLQNDSPDGRKALTELESKIEKKLASNSVSRLDVQSAFGNMVFGESKGGEPSPILYKEVFSEAFRMTSEAKIDPKFSFLSDIIKRHNLV